MEVFTKFLKKNCKAMYADKKYFNGDKMESKVPNIIMQTLVESTGCHEQST